MRLDLARVAAGLAGGAVDDRLNALSAPAAAG
jgi:hypothetical protein